jgi:hypothetical protein
MNVRYRLPLLALAILALFAALWAGWVRIGWAWPVPNPDFTQAHGALMVCGFLSTLVGLERAIALQKIWPYASPALTGLGGLCLIFGAPVIIGATLMTLGSLVLVCAFVVIVRRHFTLDTVTMALGALALLIGNTLWLSGLPIFRIVLWWSGFLILTIAGERLELGKLLKLSRASKILFAATIAIFLAGTLLVLFEPNSGLRTASLGMLLQAIWLLRFDIARRTVRQTGLPRYIAICLLTGYIWLAVGGAIGLIYGFVPAGAIYDAFLHTVFVGFVISMLFGHAPIIFPAILGKMVTYRPAFYLHLIALHLSLILRIAGDLLMLPTLRLWGGLLNGVAILLFLGVTIYAIVNQKQ